MRCTPTRRMSFTFSSVSSCTFSRTSQPARRRVPAPNQLIYRLFHRSTPENRGSKQISKHFARKFTYVQLQPARVVRKQNPKFVGQLTFTCGEKRLPLYYYFVCCTFSSLFYKTISGFQNLFPPPHTHTPLTWPIGRPDALCTSYKNSYFTGPITRGRN